jgi:hypothetical protein
MFRGADLYANLYNSVCPMCELTLPDGPVNGAATPGTSTSFN